MRIARVRRTFLFLLGAALAAGMASAGDLPAGPGDPFESLLARLHPDYQEYILSVRQGPGRFHPANLYMGLVRPGGSNPSLRGDAPLFGRGVRNDIIVYTDSRDSGRSDGWAMLLIDHEYFHARHLARGDRTPLPGFDDPEIDRHFLEAAAWGFNLAQADGDAYPGLTHADYREAFRNYTLHFESFRDYVLRRDRPAWAHYGRFLPEPSAFDRIQLAQR